MTELECIKKIYERLDYDFEVVSLDDSTKLIDHTNEIYFLFENNEVEEICY